MPIPIIDKHGNVSMEIGRIKRIGVENVTDVIAYRVFSEDGLTVHEIDFKDDGHCRFSYKEDGKLTELKCKHVKLTATTAGKAILRRFSDPG